MNASQQQSSEAASGPGPHAPGTESRTRWRDVSIYTLGHSTRTLDELIAWLAGFGITVLADIRTIPRSRRNPQFNADALTSALAARHLRYVHLPRLGGLRRTTATSINDAWRNASFRGYADYMQTEGFEAGLAQLHALTSEGTVALMCAEAVPWRCHRSLVADALTVRGAHVEHITSAHRASPHRMTPFAQVEGTRVTYPGERTGSAPLPTQAPFHLEATVRVLQRRPSNPVDVFWQERYRRVLPTSNGLALLEVADHGTIDAPDLRLRIVGGGDDAAAHAAFVPRLRRILGLDVDPQPLQALAEAEPGLRPTVRALRGMRPPRFAGLFESFANVVPFQQVSLDAGVAVVSRLVERFGASLQHEGQRFHAFPTAHAVAEAHPQAIKACGMSLRKAETLHQLARAVASGELREDDLSRVPSSDAIRTLTELPGIGPWSAALVLLRGLGRLDVFPPGDVGVARGLETLLQADVSSLEDRVDRFGDRRGYLYFCALAGAQLRSGLIHPAPPRQSKRTR